MSFPHLWDARFIMAFITSCGSAFVLNYATYLCTQAWPAAPQGPGPKPRASLHMRKPSASSYTPKRLSHGGQGESLNAPGTRGSQLSPIGINSRHEG